MPGETADDFFASNESMRSIIGSALSRKQTFIDLLPLGIPLYRALQTRPLHGPFHLPNPPRRESSPIQRASRLSDFGSPAEVGLQLRCSLKIGNVADGRDQHCGSHRSNPRNGGENLALPRGFNDLNNLRFELLQVFFQQFQFGNKLRLSLN